VFDANDGRYLMSLYAGIRDRFTAVAWSPDGRVIATLNTYQQLVLYVAEGLDKPHATSPARPITRGKIPECDAFSFSSDGHWLGYASRGHFPNGLAMIVDVENLEPLKSLEHRHRVSALTFSPDGRLLATISEEMVYLWGFTSGTRETSLPHPNSVMSIAFSPDGRSLAAQDGSDTVTLWSVSTGEQTGRLRHDDDVQLVSFSPDGATLATATPETIHVWRRLP
jgi:WD40 repeat protein